MGLRSQLQVKVACPVNPDPSAAVAVIVTFATAALQVAVTWFVGEAERWTDGSLAVQFELINAPVMAGHALPPPNASVALKTWLLPGVGAVWSAVAVAGLTLTPTGLHSPDPPPQPTVMRRIKPKDTTANNLDSTGDLLLSPVIE